MPSLALSCAKSPDIPCPLPLVKAVPSEYPLVPGFQLLQQLPAQGNSSSRKGSWHPLDGQVPSSAAAQPNQSRRS